MDSLLLFGSCWSVKSHNGLNLCKKNLKGVAHFRKGPEATNSASYTWDTFLLLWMSTPIMCTIIMNVIMKLVMMLYMAVAHGKT